MYDALNVLSAIKVIRKDKYNIFYNPRNTFIRSDISTETRPETTSMKPIAITAVEPQQFIDSI